MRPDGMARAFWLRWHRSTRFRIGVLAFGLFPSAFVCALILSAAPRAFAAALAFGAVIEVLWPVLLSRVLPAIGKRGQRILSIDSAGLTTETAGGEWHASWREVHEVVSTPEFVFLLGAGINSVAIPAQAFADEEQRNEFVNRARRYMAGASGQREGGGGAPPS
jgi:hypothetical protein